MSAGTLDVDLVNAALLGTDRREVPAPDGTDPADWLLEAAGRRRATTLVAAASVVVRPADPGPDDPRPAPSPAAREILDELLLQATPSVLDLWLREALAAGVGLAPEHWTPVLERARRSTELDRRRLGAALGPRGLWFARHNPAWSAVVRAAEVPAVDDTLAGARVREAVVALAAGEQTPGGARALGQRIGARLPLDAYALLAEAARAPVNPAARAGLGAAEEVLWARCVLAHAFDPDRVPPERQRLPSVPTRQERL